MHPSFERSQDTSENSKDVARSGRRLVFRSMLLLLATTLLLGCDRQTKPVVKPKPIKQATHSPQTDPPEETQPTQPKPRPPKSWELDQSVEAKAVRKVATAIESTAELGPTIVVWLLDGTETNSNSLQKAATEIERWYDARETTSEKEPLQTMIGLFADELQWLTNEPVTSAKDVKAALAKVRVQTAVVENTFQAASTAFDRFAEARLSEGKEVVFVIITDEAGNDESLVDELAANTKKLNTPFYIIGSPAPFGERTAVTRPIEKHDDGSSAVRHGPETKHIMHVAIPLAGSHWGVEKIDSGFGPYSLELLARASGGSFIALRPAASDERFQGLQEVWPDSRVKRYNPDVMARYTPSYVTAAQWEQVLQEHALCRALLAAIEEDEKTQTLDFPKLEFGKRNEAQLVRDLTEAQKGAAKMTPPLVSLVEKLKAGAADSTPAPSVRWQISFDLAYARALAAETRVKGYNDALAELKRGKTFATPDSTTWVLQPAALPESNSALKRNAETSRSLLQAIVNDHADTPWADFAKRELQNPIGWTWTER